MATSTWLGGYGLFDAPGNWDPNSVPGAGDTAAIGSGGALALFQSIQATVVLGSTDPGTQPALGLLDASAGTLTMPRDLPQPPYATDASPTQYGTMLVAGQGSIGTIDLGAFADQDRFSNPVSPTGEYADQRIWLAQTDAGVLLREGIPTGPTDATPIPLLPSAQA